MDRDTPTIQAMPSQEYFPENSENEPWRGSVRARLFGVVFAAVALTGIAATFLQPALYRASATVLMSAPLAIDDEAQSADVQSVAIQRRILLGSDVTAALGQALSDSLSPEIDVDYLRDTLLVEPVAETNLVEMAAQGDDARWLPGIVNKWIDVYLEVRAREIQERQQQTLRLVRDQLAGLDVKVAEARDALAQFRTEHNITSSDRQENDIVAQLAGLDEALGDAREREVKASARLRTMERAVAQGRKIVSPSERESVAAMEQELRQLRKRLERLEKTYTLRYIQNQPNLRDIPERIAELESDLGGIYSESEELQIALAQQDYETAQETVEVLAAKRRELESSAAAFTTIYATHESLANDVARLEELSRETQARLVEVQINPVDKYPQVDVIDRPGDRAIRLGPDYLLWLGASFGAALACAILAVWLYGFLAPRRARPAYVTLSGVHMYPRETQEQLNHQAEQAARLQQSQARLDYTHEGPGTDEGPGADERGGGGAGSHPAADSDCSKGNEDGDPPR